MTFTAYRAIKQAIVFAISIGVLLLKGRVYIRGNTVLNPRTVFLGLEYRLFLMPNVYQVRLKAGIEYFGMTFNS
jgi:hypothetical protein